MNSRIIRVKETESKTGYCDRQLRDMEREGIFPKRFSLNPSGKGRAVGHLESEVDEWIAAHSGRGNEKKPTSASILSLPNTKFVRVEDQDKYVYWMNLSQVCWFGGFSSGGQVLVRFSSTPYSGDATDSVDGASTLILDISLEEFEALLT